MIFPIVFVLTFASAVGQQPVTITSPPLRSSWIFVHVALIFTGYAGLFLSFGASVALPDAGARAEGEEHGLAGIEASHSADH